VEIQAWCMVAKKIVIGLLHSTLKVGGQKQKKSCSAMLGNSKLI